MSSTKKRHHIIPVLSLKHFTGASPSGHVWTYDNSSNACCSSIPEETAFESHFYSVEQTDGSKNAIIEDLLNEETEAPAAPIYEKLIRGEIITNDQKAKFSIFAAHMYLRTKAMRRVLGELYGKQLQTMTYATARNDKSFQASIERMRKDGVDINHDQAGELRKIMLDPSSLVVTVPKEVTLVCFKSAETITNVMYDLSWTILTPRNGFFVTSDNPVVRLSDPNTHHPLYGDRGFYNKSINISFPLSPKRMLTMHRVKGAYKEAEITRDQVDQLNELRSYYAERYLYAHLKDKRIITLAEKHKFNGLKFQIQGYVPAKFATVQVRR